MTSYLEAYKSDTCGVVAIRQLQDQAKDKIPRAFPVINQDIPTLKDCFHTMDFLWCVYATERHGEIDQFRKWVSILRAGRK
ncbi:Gonad-inhibiting hormone-like [Homarus americanus]|uniref:Gonad-inhibiting hormone-like n=1 Tax=Homarus americanus TaxID=6706 RepID=A0A8J5MSG9_HOMAM|nr:Gonad-inhibiting hormone-like [Homarus americanus]